MLADFVLAFSLLSKARQDKVEAAGVVSKEDFSLECHLKGIKDTWQKVRAEAELLKTEKTNLKVANQNLMTELESAVQSANGIKTVLEATVERLTNGKAEAERKCERLENENNIARRGLERLKDQKTIQRKEINKLNADCLSKDNQLRALREELRQVTEERDKKKREVFALVGQITRQSESSVPPSSLSGRPEERDDDEKLLSKINDMFTESTNIPRVEWDGIIGCQKVKDELLDLPMCRESKDAWLYEEDRTDDSATDGVLLHGKPGTVSAGFVVL